MTYLAPSKDLTHYQSKSFEVLTDDEILLYTKAPKKPINTEIFEEDHDFIRANKLNMQRITAFLIHDWLTKKREEWNM